jgi:hypothetical protein
MKLILDALYQDSNFDQLGLNLETVQELKQISDNQTEFNRLIELLNLAGVEVYEEPESLKSILE